MLLDEASIDSATGAAAVKQPFGRKGSCSGDGVEDDVDREVAFPVFESVNDTRRFM